MNGVNDIGRIVKAGFTGLPGSDNVAIALPRMPKRQRPGHCR
ncbi:MAG: hypothetical protein V6Z86_06695 [Hyphomicrobiales bacterium]